jgi:hemerythrin-like domain-containing protein
VFPYLKKAGIHEEMIVELLGQHKAGRILTHKIQMLTKTSSPKPEERQKLLIVLEEFVTMYRAHESREDTEIFPQIHVLLSPEEYDELGKEFERTEKELLGNNGFEKMLKKVMRIEKSLGIFDLAHFNPSKDTRTSKL